MGLGGSEGGVVDPAARDKYRLRVTAGPSYDTSTHTEVAVNGDDAHVMENDVMKAFLKVKIRDYNGLPRESPSTSDYFSHPLHTSDRYSIGFSFIPKKNIKGSDLVTGFDFDHSIRDRLPPGFKYAMKIVTTLLDPGIYADPYSDKPFLYGPGLSSFFSFRIGEHTSDLSAEEQLKTHDSTMKGVIEEGAYGSGEHIRADHKIPAKVSKRRKYFLDEKRKEDFVFEAGRMYQADFFNPYLDFANFALRIPGFSISVVRYIDDKTHALRFVLKDKSTNEVLFVVIFNLLFGQELEAALGEKESMDQTQRMPSRVEGDAAMDRPRTSSSYATPRTSRSLSSSSPSPSDVEDAEKPATRNQNTAATTLAGSIYSGFASLGFGRSNSSSTSETTSKSSSRERTQQATEALNKKVDDMDEGQVEAYLKNKNSSTA